MLCPSFLSPRDVMLARARHKGPLYVEAKARSSGCDLVFGKRGMVSSVPEKVMFACSLLDHSEPGDNPPKEISSGSSHLPSGCLRDLVTSPQGSRGKPFTRLTEGLCGMARDALIHSGPLPVPAPLPCFTSCFHSHEHL